MIKKTISKHPLDDPDAAARDLGYWLSRTPEERLSAVEILRRQYFGDTGRLQRTARVVQQTRD